jgi:cytidylate kinase
LIEKGNVVTFEEVPKREEQIILILIEIIPIGTWRKTLLIDNSHLTREEQFQIVLELVHDLKQNNFFVYLILILDLPLLLFKI